MLQPTRFLVAVTASVAALVLVSCAPKEAYTGQAPSSTTDGESSGPKIVQATPRVQDDDGVTAATSDSRAQRGGLLNDRLVFFDLDKSVIKTQFRATLNAHADYLSQNRNARVLLQGHADERGSTEYNLALGQRRADAVREYMIAGGVFADQIEAVSYGEERPRVVGSDESAWSQNRRVEIVYDDE